ncbi:MAG: hypothetical protein ACKVU4_07720 [Phycisphaerales bacterium]
MVEPPTLGATRPPSPAARLPDLDLDPFHAPVWVAPPAPADEAEPAKPAPAPPLKLQLLAITRAGEDYRAALYDPETDRLHVVGAGESVGGRSVDRVEANAIALRDGSGVRMLALRDDHPAAAPGGPR